MNWLNPNRLSYPSKGLAGGDAEQSQDVSNPNPAPYRPLGPSEGGSTLFGVTIWEIKRRLDKLKMDIITREGKVREDSQHLAPSELEYLAADKREKLKLQLELNRK